MNETWKDIVGYDGQYRISNFGNVSTKKRQGTKGGCLKQRKDKKGYCYVNLCKDGKYTCIAVHRLVAQAFIENTNDLPCVNHIDEVKDNNVVSNLEWCTYKYNNNYGTARERASRTRFRKCVGTWADGHKEYFDSCTLASKSTGIAQGNIWGACNGLWKHAGGVSWKYI